MHSNMNVKKKKTCVTIYAKYSLSSIHWYSYIIFHGYPWRVEFLMVWASTGRMYQSPCDAAYQKAVINSELNDSIKRLFSFIKKLV